MKFFVVLGAVSAILGILGINSASARESVVIVKAAGEAYEGPPKLGLLADGRLVGERTLQKSFDTASGKRLKTAKNRRDYVEWLKFEVPAIEGVEKLEIEFKNNARKILAASCWN
jgi:hypothetical protein